MAPRRKRRDEWRQTKKGTWTCSLGHRGLLVRLIQNEKGGFFYYDARRPDGTRQRRTLGTSERAEAERRGRRLLAALLSGGAPAAQGSPRARKSVSLGELCDRFVRECPMFLDNDEHVQTDWRIRLSILRAGIGDARDVTTL